MNRQQLAILFTGIGGLLVLSIFLIGGPTFDMTCTNEECDEAFADFILKIVWTFFATGFGSVLLLVGIVLFIIDAAQRPPESDGEEPPTPPKTK